MATVGVDVGKNGFLALLDECGTLYCEPMPMIEPSGKGKRRYDVALLVRILRTWNDTFDVKLTAVEKQQVHPGQGSVSGFSLGEGFGIMVGVVTALGIPLECPHPKTWQAEMLRDVPGSDTKARSVEACGRLFPAVDLRRTERCKGPDNNKSDSILIAEWARRRIMG